jgi:uncharacterized protein YegL
MKVNYTHITFLLDSSLSMTKIASEIIDNFNKFLKDQKEAPGIATFTFAKFANEIVYLNKFTPIIDVRYLDIELFNPRGMTALNDAICKLIDETGKELALLHEDNKPSGVLFVILTDGQENCSWHYKLADVKARVQQQESLYNWKFIYLGANVDAQQESMQLGIQDFTNYSADRAGVNEVYSNLSKSTLSFRALH